MNNFDDACQLTTGRTTDGVEEMDRWGNLSIIRCLFLVRLVQSFRQSSTLEFFLSEFWCEPKGAYNLASFIAAPVKLGLIKSYKLHSSHQAVCVEKKLFV